MKRPKSDYVIQTVANALHLLEVFRSEDELGVTELSRRLNLHKNNVFRLLATLEQEGYVEQSPSSDRYRLGVACLELGRAFARNRNLLVQARSVLRHLAHETGESAHIGVLRDFEVVLLDGEQPDRLVVTGFRVGRRLPAHCTALGKVLLGCAEPQWREAYDRAVVAEGHLTAWTPATLVDRDKLFEHLRAVGAQGYAVDIGEYEPGLCCVAAPVHDASGRVVAALSVSGPSFRMEPQALHTHLASAVVNAAEHLSQRLGHNA
jgi:DNA-binding IclR family transcriptional regulator